MNVSKPKHSRPFTFSSGDKIALAAFLLSFFNFAWFAWGEWLGPEITLAELSNEVMELRCISGAQACWNDSEDGSPIGRTMAILPVYLTNFGAPNQNEVIRRARVEVELPEIDLSFELRAIAVWGTTAAGRDQGDRGPFKPIIVAGRSSGGSEVRFTPFESQHRVPWAEVAGALIDGQVTKIKVTLTVTPMKEAKELSVNCMGNVSETAKKTIERRRQSNGSPYLAFVCS